MSSIAFLFWAAAVAAPATSDFDFDVQCMIATQQASGQLEGELAFAAQLAAMYYFGRVDSGLSSVELERRMAAAAKEIEGRPLGPLLEKCGDYMKVRGKLMEDLGARLERREKASQIQ
jgi:hypothetical protein